MRRQRDHAIATPVSLIARLARATSLAEVRWAEAREKNDFALFAPHLDEVLHAGARQGARCWARR